MKQLLYSNLTAQQQKLAQDAIDQCLYPIANIFDLTLYVNGGDPHAAGSSLDHAYMYTSNGTQNNSPVSTITITPWADDPNNLNNAGLPNPAADIFEFFRQSFVHELGHVIIGSIFNTLNIQNIAGMFWKAQNNTTSGRVYGTANDWSGAAAWGDNIVEAVAECCKCAFYTGRLIYENRTNWRIDAENWPALMDAILPGAATGFLDDFTSDKLSTYDFGPGVDYAVGGGLLTLTSNKTYTGQAGATSESWTWREKTKQNNHERMSVKVVSLPAGSTIPQIQLSWDSSGSAAGYMGAVTAYIYKNVHFAIQDLDNSLTTYGPRMEFGSDGHNIGPDVLLLKVEDDKVPTETINYLVIPLPALPFWLAMSSTDGQVINGEIWLRDPAMFGDRAADYSISVDRGSVQPLLNYSTLNVTQTVGTDIYVWTFSDDHMQHSVQTALPGDSDIAVPSNPGGLCVWDRSELHSGVNYVGTSSPWKPGNPSVQFPVQLPPKQAGATKRVFMVRGTLQQAIRDVFPGAGDSIGAPQALSLKNWRFGTTTPAPPQPPYPFSPVAGLLTVSGGLRASLVNS